MRAADDEFVETVASRPTIDEFVEEIEFETDELKLVTRAAIDDELLLIDVVRVPIEELYDDDAV